MPEKRATNRKGLLARALLIGFLIISPPRCTHIDATTTAHANADAPGDRTTRNLRTVEHENSNHQFTFAVTADMRYFSGPSYHTSQYFRGACEAIAGAGSGAFMVIPGDIDPTTDVNWTITQTLGITYTWYPVVGNHELPNAGYEPYPGANMDWLRAHDYGTVNPGPSGCPQTTYSFNYENAHLVMLNEYCDAGSDTVTDGDMPDHLYSWLVNDLDNTDKTLIFVFGHEPAYPQPDADNGRVRHLGDSLDQNPANRDRFWDLLRSRDVVAYICGHTHNFSAAMIDGVWQLDAGHARGLGDTGAQSTFILVHVDGSIVTFEAYRDDASGGPYTLAHRGVLVGMRYYLPMVMHTYSH
jgi:hypothetical protein